MSMYRCGSIVLTIVATVTKLGLIQNVSLSHWFHLVTYFQRQFLLQVALYIMDGFVIVLVKLLPFDCSFSFLTISVHRLVEVYCMLSISVTFYRMPSHTAAVWLIRILAARRIIKQSMWTIIYNWTYRFWVSLYEKEQLLAFGSSILFVRNICCLDYVGLGIGLGLGLG